MHVELQNDFTINMKGCGVQSLLQFKTVDLLRSLNTKVGFDLRRKVPLSPGLIALITITSTFVFFMTIMLIVCIGEYCQYMKRKKSKRQVHERKPRHNQNRSTDGEICSGTSISQSENTSTAVHNNPHSSPTKMELKHASAYTNAFENAQKNSIKVESRKDQINNDKKNRRDKREVDGLGVKNDKQELTALVSRSVTSDRFCDSESSVRSSIDIDCDIKCATVNGTNRESVRLDSQSYDDLEADGEILCDSVDSKEGYPGFQLEADV
ncbi:hypothetical protein MAR_018429 [Mya arenaria]|uniref:Uncharacterized protein n=1 Tax=Mya arenaria TaxID=6604 RepID=A0ABY7EMQ9_MYAAR|nr:hypothetical protein MAR_018429 [Mya arenaria]